MYPLCPIRSPSQEGWWSQPTRLEKVFVRLVKRINKNDDDDDDDDDELVMFLSCNT